MSRNDDWMLKFGNPAEDFRWGSLLILEPTHGTMDKLYSARLRDPVGIGVGDSPLEAAVSFAHSLQRAAEDILKRVANGELQ